MNRISKKKEFLWHHSMPLHAVQFATVNQKKARDRHPNHACSIEECAGLNWPDDDYHWDLYMDAAYLWMEERAGFWPLFLAVGDDHIVVTITGYYKQWQRLKEYQIINGQRMSSYVKPGEFSNYVLFSFSEEPKGVVYNDYDWWHVPLNGASIKYSPDTKECKPFNTEFSKSTERFTMKPYWDKSRWLKAACSKSKHEPTVQGVIQELDLRKATRIWCRNIKTKNELIRLGFDKTIVHIHKVNLKTLGLS